MRLQPCILRAYVGRMAESGRLQYTVLLRQAHSAASGNRETPLKVRTCMAVKSRFLLLSDGSAFSELGAGHRWGRSIQNDGLPYVP